VSAPYFVICDGCQRPSGLGSITMTNPNYSVYNGVTVTVNKRYSDRWQLNGSVTVQDNPDYFPEGSVLFINPTGREFRDGVSTIARYLFKLNGSYDLPWGIMAAGNLNINDGGNRTLEIDGPGNVYGGVNAAGNPTTINYGELEFQKRGSERFEMTTLLDLGLQKTFVLPASRYRLKLMFDAFNVFNSNKILEYSSDNLSEVVDVLSPDEILPPRVFRIGASFTF
jgi:hypothetical protein